MSLAPRVIEKIPFSFLVYSFVSGMILLFFSPLRFLVPAWLVFFFSAGSPSDIWAIFISIILCALFLGVPIFLLHPLIAGDRGFNHRLMTRINETHPREEVSLASYFAPAKDVEFWKWIQRHPFTHYLIFSTILQSIVDSSLIGCEVTFIFFNWLGIILFILKRAPFIDVVVYLGVFPIFIGLCSYIYQKKYFKNWFRELWNRMRCTFIGHFLKQRRESCFIVMVNNKRCPIDPPYKYCKREKNNKK